MPGLRISRRSVLGSVGVVSLTSALTPQALAQTHHGEAVSGDSQLPVTESVFVARLDVGASQRAMVAGQRWAAIHGGEVAGPLLKGRIQQGRITWQVNAASQCVEITASFAVLCADGALIQVQDRSVHPLGASPATIAGLSTTPSLLDAAGEEMSAAGLLVGRLDAREFASGRVMLQVFRVV
jgi:hypothetical protein